MTNCRGAVWNCNAEREWRCGTPRAVRVSGGHLCLRQKHRPNRQVRTFPTIVICDVFVIHGRLGRRNAAPTVVLIYISGVRKDRARHRRSATGAGQGLCRTLSAAKLFPSAGQRPSASPSYSENLPQYPFPSGSGLSCAYPLP